ncbi:hypothetical protein [Niallia taxi]|uniref:hypothetical protein n=1 Tax=Niallia taxi TaxID=2499688 RepID=UPI0030086F4E
MKSRHKKHLQRIEKRSPIIVFTQEDVFVEDTVVNKNELRKLDTVIGLFANESYCETYKLIKKDFYNNISLFVDNYLTCGNNRFIYILVPRNKETYKIIVKEYKSKWQDKYWQKEDPENKRNWCYYDEDTSELGEFLMSKFKRYSKI